MAKPLVVLADTDEAYLAALECRFLEGLAELADIEAMSDERFLLEFASQPHDIEAMLVSEDLSGSHLSSLNVAHLFVLAEERDGDDGIAHTCDMDASRLFKYGALDLIYNKVVTECAALREHDVVRSTRIVLFHTPVGGAGTTTLALAVASALNAMYKRVLYVDAEYVQSFTSYLTNGALAVNDMARAMNLVDGNAFENVRGYIAHDGFDYVPPLRTGLANYDVDFSFYERFVAAAKASARYDYVVVDTDGRFDERTARLLALADRIVVPTMQDEHALHKLMKLFDNIDVTDAERYVFVCNKFRTGEGNAFSSESGSSPVALDTYAHYDPAIPDMDAHALGQIADFKKLAYVLA